MKRKNPKIYKTCAVIWVSFWDNQVRYILFFPPKQMGCIKKQKMAGNFLAECSDNSINASVFYRKEEMLSLQLPI